jgi:hypothetical protein
MADIEIVVKKSEVQETSTSVINSDSSYKPIDKKKDVGKKSLEQVAIETAIMQVSKQMITTGVNQFGNLTGDYQFARSINAATSLFTDAVTMAKLGPAGAIYVAGKYATNIAASLIDVRNKEIELNVMRERAGLISTKGSRY